jgi:hypothetical protein
MEGDQSKPSEFDASKHDFKIPAKKIDDPMTLEQFKNSDACKELIGFITALSLSVQKSRMTETTLTDVTIP